jgi:hypothetical protein
MNWIRMSNAGSFDVVTAIQMMGASVKESDNPIGLYGSGAKYALAQAARQGIRIKIADRGNLLTLTTTPQEFRGESFDMVSLKTKTGKVHKTGVTTRFGQEDWTDKWFIFREFYSNMLDEGGTMEIVDGLPTTEGVDVFLPYDSFKEIVENLTDYFDLDLDIRKGSGRIFKKGVFIGCLDGINIDVRMDLVEITETRTLKKESAERTLAYRLEYCQDAEVWTAFLQSDEKDRINIYMKYALKPVEDAFKIAFHEAYGDNAVACPDIEWMVKDAIEIGLNPVVIPKDWAISFLPTLADHMPDAEYRVASVAEQCKIEAALRKLKDFTGDLVLDVKIFRSELIDGTNILGTCRIGLSENIVNGPELQLLSTLIHEINHAKTKAVDYSREFPRGYEEYLAKLMM